MKNHKRRSKSVRDFYMLLVYGSGPFPGLHSLSGDGRVDSMSRGEQGGACRAQTSRLPCLMLRSGKELLDRRQNERRIKFIGAGDAVRTVGQLKGESTLNRAPQSTFIPRV